MVKEFLTFLKEYKIVTLAVAFVMGTASTALVNSLVKDILMPLIEPLFPTDSWKEAVLTLGPFHIGYGSFLAELLNFLILALVIFLVVKKLLSVIKKDKAEKKREEKLSD